MVLQLGENLVLTSKRLFAVIRKNIIMIFYFNVDDRLIDIFFFTCVVRLILLKNISNRNWGCGVGNVLGWCIFSYFIVILFGKCQSIHWTTIYESTNINSLFDNNPFNCRVLEYFLLMLKVDNCLKLQELPTEQFQWQNLNIHKLKY